MCRGRQICTLVPGTSRPGTVGGAGYKSKYWCWVQDQVLLAGDLKIEGGRTRACWRGRGLYLICISKIEKTFRKGSCALIIQSCIYIIRTVNVQYLA